MQGDRNTHTIFASPSPPIVLAAQASTVSLGGGEALAPRSEDRYEGPYQQAAGEGYDGYTDHLPMDPDEQVAARQKNKVLKVRVKELEAALRKFMGYTRMRNQVTPAAHGSWEVPDWQMDELAQALEARDAK